MSFVFFGLLMVLMLPIALALLGTRVSLTKPYRAGTASVAAIAEPGVGDEGCKLPSASGINQLPVVQQAAVFAAVATGLAVSTQIGISGFEGLKALAPGPIGVWQSSWGLLGAIYALAGVAHFTVMKDFANIMPATGAWGFWYLPGSKEFHVAWTGVVEFTAGVWLLLGTVQPVFNANILPTIWSSPTSDAAFVLLCLTVLVTPANIYMYTHGAKLPVSGPEVPITFHLIRGAMQVVLFVMFYELAKPTLSLLLL